MKVLITRKVGMSSAISENGDVIPITLLSAQPNVVTQIKTIETDGYTAVQLGTEAKAHLNKPKTGHLKKAKAATKHLKEFRPLAGLELPEDLKVGDKLTAETFAVGDTVHVTGISKGKGFAGTIKRHGFQRGRKTHGGGSYRRPGSIGSMFPQKIFKGKKMAGQMGHTQVTVRNLKVTYVDAQENVLGVSGAVPGPRRGLVLVRGS